MSGDPGDIDDDVLMAFVDGRLVAAEAERVSRWLELHPEKAAEVMAWRRQNEALSALFPPVQGALPHRSRGSVRRENGARGRRWGAIAAAGLLVALLGGGAGWLARDWTGRDPQIGDALIADAMVAHRLYTNEKRHAVEVAASDEDHLVSWLSNRLERKIDAPDLSAQGFTLIGGRLLPRNAGPASGPAAQLMYENAGAGRLTVYITAGPNAAGPAYQVASAGGQEAFYWANELITCTVVGSLPRAELELVARQVYRQLDWPPPGESRGSESW